MSVSELSLSLNCEAIAFDPLGCDIQDQQVAVIERILDVIVDEVAQEIFKLEDPKAG